MKRFVVSLGVLGVLLTASSATAQRGPACMTVACDLQADWAGNIDGLMGIANAMRNTVSSRRRRSKVSPSA
jgi:hypothetical protein